MSSLRNRPLISWIKRGSFVLSSLLVLIGPLSVLPVYAGVNTESLTIETAVQIAVGNNPNLAQLQARYKALSLVPSQVGTLPDPTISVGGVNFPVAGFDRTQEAMTQVQVGFTQAFPYPGKLSLKQETAEFKALAVNQSVAELRLQLINKVRRQWWQIYYLTQALDTVRDNQALFVELIKVAKTKYETGSGLQQDVLLAQLEHSRLLDQEIQIKALRKNEAIKLYLLMDMPAETDVTLATIVGKAMPEIANKEILFDKAKALRPLLKQKQFEVDAANSRLNLAKKDVYPDFTLGVSYGFRGGDNPAPRGGSRDDFMTVKLGVKVPLYKGRKQAKAIDQRATELQGSLYSSRDSFAVVMTAITSAMTDYEKARETFSLYETGIIPQATQTVESMLAGYQVDEVDFLNLTRAQITLLNYELQYWKALTEAKQSLARLEAAVGEESIYE